MEGQERVQRKSFKRLELYQGKKKLCQGDKRWEAKVKSRREMGSGRGARKMTRRWEGGGTAWHYFPCKSLSSTSSFRRLWVKREVTG